MNGFSEGTRAAAARQLRDVASVLDIPEHDLARVSVRRILQGLSDPNGSPATIGGV
jgi:hypothetical protein